MEDLIPNDADAQADTVSVPPTLPRIHKHVYRNHGIRKDKCGNPHIWPKDGVLSRHDIKQIKSYSLHCVQWKLYMNALVRKAQKYAFKVQCEKRNAANAQKFLSVARQQVKDWEKDKETIHHFKVRDQQHLAEISLLKIENEHHRTAPPATEAQLIDTLTPTREQELQHQLAAADNCNQRLRDDLEEALTKVRDLTARRIERERDGLDIASTAASRS